MGALDLGGSHAPHGRRSSQPVHGPTIQALAGLPSIDGRPLRVELTVHLYLPFAKKKLYLPFTQLINICYLHGKTTQKKSAEKASVPAVLIQFDKNLAKIYEFPSLTRLRGACFFQIAGRSC